MKTYLIIGTILVVLILIGGGFLLIRNLGNNQQDTFTRAEVAKHNTVADCYLIIGKDVIKMSQPLSKITRGEMSS